MPQAKKTDAEDDEQEDGGSSIDKEEEVLEAEASADGDEDAEWECV